MEWKIIFYFSKDMMLYVGPCSSHWVSWKEMKDAYYKLGHCYDSIYDYIYYCPNIIEDKTGI